MVTEIVSKIWDYLFNLFGHHDIENPEKFSKQVLRQSIGLIIISIIWGIALSVLIYRVGINDMSLANEVEKGENVQYKPTSLAIGMIVAILLFAWTVGVYAYGVLKDLKPNFTRDLISEPIKESIQNDVSFLQLKQCKQCSNYFLSSSFIVNRIEQLTSHSDFVNICLKLSTQTHPEGLSAIKDYFNSNYSCKLLCLLTNPQYYTPQTNPNNLIDLLQYFESFYPLKKEGKRIKRVFNLSALGNKSDNYYDEKKKWMFQYVLMNVITGVETCVLDDTKDNQLHHLIVDYVIGMDSDKKNSLYSNRKLFLSYQDTNEEKVLVFEDQLLTNVFEADFYERLKGNSNNGGYSVVRRRSIIDKKDKMKIDINDINNINVFLNLTQDIMISCVKNMIQIIKGTHSSFNSSNSPKELQIEQKYKIELVNHLEKIVKVISKCKVKK